jgi:hypothetical protein
MSPSILSMGKVLTCYTKYEKLFKRSQGWVYSYYSLSPIQLSWSSLSCIQQCPSTISLTKQCPTNKWTDIALSGTFFGGWRGGGRSNNKSLLIWTLLNTSPWTCLSKATRIGGISTTIMGKLWTYLMSGPLLCSKKCLRLNLVLGPLPISISPLAYCLRTWHKDPLHSFVM